jgi:hypothetical protein
MRSNKNLYLALIILLVTGLLVIYYKFDPAKYSFFPKCPFHQITGLDCPGCGSQRALYCLLHGNIKKAASYNLLLVISLPFLIVHFGYRISSIAFNEDTKWQIIYHPLTPKIIFVLVMLFWIVRNVPVWPFNYLSANHSL